MGNYALIQGRGTQAITATGMSLQGGAGGQENFAAITAPTQTVTVHGNLSLVGGASATGTVRGRRGQDWRTGRQCAGANRSHSSRWMATSP
jgi:hypothetical protein